MQGGKFWTGLTRLAGLGAGFTRSHGGKAGVFWGRKACLTRRRGDTEEGWGGGREGRRVLRGADGAAPSRGEGVKLRRGEGSVTKCNLVTRRCRSRLVR